MRRRASVWMVLVCLLIGTRGVFAQQTGEIFGRVTDASGAVLPGVTVTLTSSVLLQPLSAATSETGSYRFPGLPVGTYSVKFEIGGFRGILRENIRVGIGFNAQVNQVLEVSSLEEVVTVTSEAPIVDTRQTGTGATFTLTDLQSIPTARDPWVMLQQTPGIIMDRENVGGNMSGQQSGFISRGGGGGLNKWNLDGVDITDQAALGASPVYFDFDSFEEMQVSTGGADVTQQTGGVGINLVTKSGTDTLRGSSRFYVTDEEFQDDNVSAEIKAQNAGAGAPIQNIKDYGIEAGGPIYRGRAWFWGSYSKQDIKNGVLGFYKKEPGCSAAELVDASTSQLRGCLESDQTILDNYNIKAQAAPFRGNKVTWHSNYADKIRNARDASDLRPIETTFRQTGPVWTHKFSDQQIFTDRWMAEIQVAHVGGGFGLDFHEDSLTSVQPIFNITTGAWSRSYTQSLFDRPAFSVDGTTNYFLPATLGGDHSFKVGFRYRDTPSSSTGHWGGNTIARFENVGGVPVAREAQMYRDSAAESELTNLAFFAQDTVTRGRFTFDLGLRLDRQDEGVGAASVAAHPFLAEWLPAVDFQGADSGVVFTNLSPRVGATYDFSGTGKTIVRANYARFYGQLSPGGISGILNPLDAAWVRFPWTDLNGDNNVQRNEIEAVRSKLIAFGGNYNPDNPTQLATSNSVDGSLKNESIDEFVAGFEKDLGFGLAVGFNYVWRKYDNFRWDSRYFADGTDFTSSHYRQVAGFVATGCPSGACPAVTYYEPIVSVPGIQRRENRPGLERTFNGFELTARKRFSGRWTMSGSFAYNDTREHYRSPAAYEDPSNIENLDNAQWAPEAGGSGVANVFQNAKWVGRVSGMYALPWNVNLAANYNMREGYPFPQFIQTNNRANSAGRASIFLKPLGESRYSNFQMVDFKLEKVFPLPRRAHLDFSMDVFNLFNVNTELARQRQQNNPSANLLSGIGIVAPRVLRFGARFVF